MANCSAGMRRRGRYRLWWSLRTKDRGLAPLRRFEMNPDPADRLADGRLRRSDITRWRAAGIRRGRQRSAHLYAMRLDRETPWSWREPKEHAIRSILRTDNGSRPGKRQAQENPGNRWTPGDFCDAADSHGGTWSTDGNVYAVLDTTGKIWRIPADGGGPVVVADLSPSLLAYPQILPGASALLLTSALGGADETTIEVVSLKDGSRKVVGRGGTAARYLPNGYLVYVSGGTLFAVAFDAVRRETRGAPVAIRHRQRRVQISFGKWNSRVSP